MKREKNKIQILRFVAEQGVVTVDDVMRKFGLWKEDNAVRVAMNKLGIRHFKYGDYRHGVWFVEDEKLFDLLSSYPKLPKFKVRGKNLLPRIEHSLGLNEIRNIVEKTDKIKVVKWWSEEFIRALSFRQRGCISTHKVPDAVFWRERKDGSLQKFFVEYERSLKTPIRYARIFEYYANREDVKNKNVLYICENDLICHKLQKTEEKLVKGGVLKGLKLFFQFTTLEDFNKTFTQGTQKGDQS